MYCTPSDCNNNLTTQKLKFLQPFSKIKTNSLINVLFISTTKAGVSLNCKKRIYKTY